MRRYDFIDLLRGLSALVVLICHFRWFWDFAYEGAPLPARSVLAPIYLYGGLAVQIFWALSGFVFWTAYGERRQSAKTFWLHRFARLYPLHLLTLLIMAVLQFLSWRTTGGWTVYGNNDLRHFVLQLFMASNWFSMENSFNAPIWSVSVEVLIYAAFLIFMRRPSAVMALTLSAMSYALYALTVHQIPFCASLFFFGVFMSILAPEAHRTFGAWALPLSVCGLAVVAAIIALVAQSDPGRAQTIAAFTGPPSVLAIFVALDYRTSLPKSFHWIGLITYSVYLLHIPILVSFRLAGVYPPLWLFCAVVIAVGFLSYRFIEAPAQRWIRANGDRLIH